MADVEMPDAGSALPGKGKAAAKTSKAVGSGDTGSDGKKRFEVKKVSSVKQIKHQQRARSVQSPGVFAM
ncbi:MAG: hypothetical protein M1830_002441 [Pleopsidium flavum]|nr:MAG: hypothetical protein M1830_002441 [Pleopsidium flavum]